MVLELAAVAGRMGGGGGVFVYPDSRVEHQIRRALRTKKNQRATGKASQSKDQRLSTVKPQSHALSMEPHALNLYCCWLSLGS